MAPRHPRRRRAVVAIAALALTCAPTPPLAMSYRASVTVASAACAPDAVTGKMVQIPPGTFEMGYTLGDADEAPVRLLAMPGFEIDRTEVTVRAYAACVGAGVCTLPAPEPYCNWPPKPANANHPINCVAWFEAEAFCAWAGKRLPSEEEWEYAARGPQGFRYPWGNTSPKSQACWDGEGNEAGQGGRRGTCAVGEHPMARSPFGIDDMAGNVLEWTQDIYAPKYEGVGQPGFRVNRGGSWVTFEPRDLRTSLRMRAPALRRDFTLGFRCAR